MLSKPQIRIPKTTLVYLGILVILVVGAIIREINLLIILAGMMAGPLVISWRMIRTNLNQLEVTRRIPRGAASSTPFDVRYTVSNRRKHIDTWAVAIADTIQHLTFPDRPLEHSACFLARVSVGETRVAHAPIRLARRGRYRWGPLRVSTRVPIGLLDGNAFSTRTDEMVVYPRLGYLLRGWKQLVQFDETGQRNSHQRRGMLEGDFFGLRDFRAGDSRRWIHWRSSAKRNDLVVRQFEQKRNQDLVLLLDLTNLPQFALETLADDDRGPIETAVSLTATAVADHCRHGAGRLTLRVAGQHVGELRGPAGQGTMNDAFELLAEAMPRRDAQSPFEQLGRLPELQRDDRIVIIRPGSIDPARWTGVDDASDVSRQRISGAITLDTTQPTVQRIFTWDDPQARTVKTDRSSQPRPNRTTIPQYVAPRETTARNPEARR